MERMLLKMARQLNAYDEASLMSLWEKYAAQAESFEPSQRWEEAVLVFGLIQAVHLKNQLFNRHLAAGAKRGKGGDLPGTDAARAWLEKAKAPAAVSGTQPAKTGGNKDHSGRVGIVAGNDGSDGREGKAAQRCKVLRFHGRKGDKPA